MDTRKSAIRYSPGPYKCTLGHDGYDDVYYINGADDTCVAQVVFWDCDHEWSARAAANARLLAAAPELIRAVEHVLIASEDGGDMNDIDWDLLRAAVAKAMTTPTSPRFDADEEPSLEIPRHSNEGDGQ